MIQTTFLLRSLTEQSVLIPIKESKGYDIDLYGDVGDILMGAKRKNHESSNKGTCANMVTIRRLDLEARIFEAHKQRLMEPQLFALFCEELTREINLLRMEGRAQLSGAQNKLKRITRELDKLLDLYLTDTSWIRRAILPALIACRQPKGNCCGFWPRQVHHLHFCTRIWRLLTVRHWKVCMRMFIQTLNTHVLRQRLYCVH